MPAVTDAYASALEYRSKVQKSDAGDDADVEMDLKAVSRWLDRKLNRFFTQDSEDVARVFYPYNMPRYSRPFPGWAEMENPWVWSGYSRWLYIDDLVSVTSIIPDTSWSGLFIDPPLNLTTDVELWPQNAPFGPEPKPYTAIFIPVWTTTIAGFMSDQRVQVTGKWGWPAVPEAIRRATIELTAIWRLESPRATTRVNELDQVVGTSQTANTMVNELIRQYQRTSSII